MSEIGKDGKIIFDQTMAENLYAHFVWYMHRQWGGPAAQRTPPTNKLADMATMLRNKEGTGYCYALCAEYLSNHGPTHKAQFHAKRSKPERLARHSLNKGE